MVNLVGVVRLKCIKDVYVEGDTVFVEGKMYDALKDRDNKVYKVTDEKGNSRKVNYFSNEEVKWVKEYFKVV